MNDFSDYYDQELTLPDGKSTTYAQLLVIDKDNLSAEFASHAAWLGYIGVLSAEAEADYEQAKLELETLYAEKDAQARLEFNSKNVKFTEKMIEAWVNMDGAYINAQQAKVEALKMYKILRALETAMKEKGSMLVSLGAMVRQEMDMTGMQIKVKGALQ